MPSFLSSCLLMLACSLGNQCDTSRPLMFAQLYGWQLCLNTNDIAPSYHRLKSPIKLSVQAICKRMSLFCLFFCLDLAALLCIKLLILDILTVLQYFLQLVHWQMLRRLGVKLHYSWPHSGLTGLLICKSFQIVV